MPTGKLRFYWDTAPLIAWLKDEARDDPNEMEGLAEVLSLVDRSQAVLMTSVLWRAEILSGQLTGDQTARLKQSFEHGWIEELSIDSRVMELAGEIRSFHKSVSNQDRKGVLQNVRVPDAIHLASAIHYEADEFHTFDGKKANGQSSGLLTLDGNVANHRLKICAPSAIQLRLNFGSADST